MLAKKTLITKAAELVRPSHKKYNNNMKNFGYVLISALFFSGTPVLSHGSNSDCSEECNSYYCPNGDSNKKIPKNN